MQVKLKVIGGSHAGKEIKVSLAKFFIGRGEDCHLRPQSDLISRHHCAIIIENGACIMRDLKSRNGTLVNGEKIAGDYVLKLGDVVKVGPLEFEVLIDHSLGGAKKPKVTDVKDAAARVMQTEKVEVKIEDDISSWLEEADEEERTKRIQTPQTRQFKLDTAALQALQAASAAQTEGAAAPAHDTGKQAAAAVDTKTADKGKKEKTEKKEKEKKEYGKLPKLDKDSSPSSRDAAAEMLKKFFNRR
jgi:pSer/pThr/pTyr-binding forkhead associated (FHA) protein